MNGLLRCGDSFLIVCVIGLKADAGCNQAEIRAELCSQQPGFLGGAHDTVQPAFMGKLCQPGYDLLRCVLPSQLADILLIHAGEQGNRNQFGLAL